MTLFSSTDQVRHAELANAIRFLAMDAVEKAQSGHPGMPMGMADVATVLFTRFLKFDPKHPKWADRDRFVLSAGHGSMLLYAILYLTGYEDIDIERIKNFRQMGSLTDGHPEYGHLSGVEVTSGPLGQGLATAVGMAIAERMLAARHGDNLIDHFTYVIAGDGCLMEGVSQEAISLAGHLCLDRLIVLWDDNDTSIDGDISLSCSDDQLTRFAASGWHVQRVNGHDPEAVAQAITAAQLSRKPSMIACKTIIGYGAPTKAGSNTSHGSPLGAKEIEGARANLLRQASERRRQPMETGSHTIHDAPLGAAEIERAREQLGWQWAPFEVPDAVLDAWRVAGARHADSYAAWDRRFSALPAYERNEFIRTQEGRLPKGWLEQANSFKRKLCGDKPNWATRKSSGEVLEILAEAIPELTGGCADLTGSCLTKTRTMTSVVSDDFSGRYMHWGIREHGMAAAMNGIALHGGFIPYGGSFLVFVDYMRPAMRLSALMKQRVIYVMTHDSIGLGEDGPTHQPVEHLASLRCMPNMSVYRPADAVETLECWLAALENDKGPSVLALTRQNVPPLRTEYTEENLCKQGAYVLLEAVGERRVTFMATGSEVALAVRARELLQAENIGAAVVSMPCWELFESQPKAYRDKVLGNGTVRVAIEAAGGFGWDRYVGPEGVIVGMPGFGLSAPAEELYKHFGITGEDAAAAARAKLQR